ncbi:hypothetical protein P280DRAFT_554650 [Massarina eburnea CBS 473.64]|uniref:Uncharacterized protein n=1 Tax=Massarina eburnea CBS 473.64 TaxID=1395130 RepID=A0A6A6RGI4_9PLEO|nr:hypothetical protein P280DRAFT_554650 [Massarina eburnea CBS 473.64]
MDSRSTVEYKEGLNHHNISLIIIIQSIKQHLYSLQLHFQNPNTTSNIIPPKPTPTTKPTTKMYTITTLITFFTAALAAPAMKPRTDFATVNFSLTNDMTGATQPSSVLENSTPHSFSALFADTNLVVDGRVFATSLQTTTAISSGTCTVDTGAGYLVGTLDAQTTFLDLDGSEGALEIDVTDYRIVCKE